jgi:hypothetical protein
MKKVVLMILAAGVIAAIPASSYALVDAGVYGGYTFSGKTEGDADDTTGYKGPQFGAMAHLNMNNPLFVLGAGPYIEMAKYKNSDLDVNLDRSVGLDAWFGLNVIPVITPYVRVGLGLMDKWTVKSDFGEDSQTNYLKTWYAAIGLSKSIVPLVQVFGEFRYASSKLDGGDKFNRSMANIGVMLNF